MAFGLPPLKVLVDAETTGFTSGVDQAISKTQEFKGAVADSRSGVSQFQSILGTVASVGSRVATGLGIAADAFGGLALASAKVEGVRDALDSMAASAGTSAEEIVNQMKVATAGTVSEANIMQSAVQALSLIGREAFGDFADEFSQASDLVRRAARATGQDVDFLMNSLVLGVGRSSKVILDNLGIMVDVTGAQEAYAQSLGKTRDELTDAEAKAATWNAALAALRDRYGDVAASSGGLNESSAQLRAAFADLAQAAGTDFIPVMQKATRIVAEDFLPIIESTLPHLEGLFDAIASLPDPVFAAGAAFIQLKAAASVLGPILATLGFEIAALTGPVGLVVAAVAGLAVAWQQDWGGIRTTTTSVIDDLRESLAGFVERLNEAAGAQNEMADATARAAAHYAPYVAAARDMAEAQHQAEEATAATSVELQRHANVVREAEEAVRREAEALLEAGRSAESFDAVLTRSTQTTQAFGDVFPAVAQKAAALGVSIDDLEPTLEGLTAAQDRMAQAAEEAWGRFEQSVDSAVSQILSTEQQFSDRRQAIHENANQKISEIWTRAGEKRAQKVAQIEAEIARAEAEGNTERVAELRAALDEQLAAINTNAAQKQAAVERDMDRQLQELESGYSQQQDEQKKALAEMVLQQVDAWQLMGEVTREQADEMRAAIVDGFGAMVDESALATGKLIGDLMDWKEGSGTTAESIVDDIENIDTIAQDLADAEARRQEDWARSYEARTDVHRDWSDAVVDGTDVVDGAIGALGDTESDQSQRWQDSYAERMTAMAVWADGSVVDATQVSDQITTLAGTEAYAASEWMASFQERGTGVQLWRDTTVSGMDTVIGKSSEVRDAIVSIPRQWSTDVYVRYNAQGDPVKFGSPRFRLAYALDDLRATSDRLQPIDVIVGAVGIEDLDKLIGTFKELFDLLGEETFTDAGEAARATQTVVGSMRSVFDLMKVTLDIEELAREAGITDLPALARRGVDLVRDAWNQATAELAFSRFEELFDAMGEDTLADAEEAARATSTIIRALKSGLDLIQISLDLEQLVQESGITDLPQMARDGTQALVGILAEAVGVLQDALADWTTQDVAHNTIAPETRDMVESWADIAGILSGAVRDVEGLLEAGRWQNPTEIMILTRRGMDNLIVVLDMAYFAIASYLAGWTAQDVAHNTIAPETQEMVESWSDAMGILSGAVRDVEAILEAAAWQNPTEIMILTRRGMDNLIVVLDMAYFAIASYLAGWTAQDVAHNTIAPETQEMVESWSDIADVLSDSLDAVEGLLEAAGWQDDAASILARVRAGAEALLGYLRAAAEAIVEKLQEWTDSDRWTEPIDEETQDTVDSWESVTDTVAGGVDSIQDLVAFADWHLEVGDIQAKVDDAVDAVIEAARTIADAWHRANIQVTEEEAEAADNLDAVVGLLANMVDLVKDASDMDVDGFTAEVQRKLVDALKRVALAVNEAVFGHDGLVAQSDTILEDLQAAATALEPLGDAMQSALDAISAAVDIGQLGRETQERGDFTEVVDRFEEFFTAGIGRLQDAVHNIATALGSLANDQAFVDAADDATAIEAQLESLAGEVQNIADMAQNVYEIGTLGEGEGEPAWARAMRDGISRLDVLLNRLADVLNGLTVPDVDLGWLTALMTLLGSIVSGDAPETNRALEALKDAAGVITSLLNAIVDAVSGKGIKNADTEWLEALFELLLAIIQAQDFGPPAKKAVDTIGEGLQTGAEGLPRDPQLLLSLDQLQREIQRLFQEATVVQVVSPSLAGVAVSDQLIADIIAKIRAQIGALDVQPAGLNVTLPDEAAIDLGDLPQAVVDKLVAELATPSVKPAGLTVASPGQANINLEAAVLTDIGEKISSGVGQVDTKPAGISIFSPGLSNVSIADAQLGEHIKAEITSYAASLAADAKPASISVTSPGTTHITVQEDILADLQAKVADSIDAAEVALAAITVKAQTDLNVDVQDTAIFKDQVAAAFDSEVFNVDVKPDSIDVVSSPSIKVTVAAGLAADVAQEIQDAVNAELGNSITISGVHVKDMTFDDSLIDTSLDFAANVQNIVEHGLNATLGRSLDAEVGALNLGVGDVNLSELVAQARGTLVDALYELASALRAAGADLRAAINELRTSGVAGASGLRVSEAGSAGNGGGQGGIHHHYHLTVESVREAGAVAQDFRVMEALAGA